MRFVAALVLFAVPLFGRAATPAVEASSATVAVAGSGKATRQILADLKLSDARLEADVRAILDAHFPALAAWHQEHDPQLKLLWSQFDEARRAKDSASANDALEHIAAVYATFRPQHDAFLAQLAGVLTPAQVERVEDVLTVDKVQVTYRAYQEIFSTLTEPQKDFVLAELKAARAEAIDAGAMTEKSAFFKKHKIRIEEQYFPTQGIDAQKFRRAFAAKAKSAAPASSPPAAAGASPLTLWYAQPAAKWEEALPIGSGRLGAMIFGGLEDERIQFNEDTLWTGHPHDYVRAGSGEVVPEVRRLIAAGQTKAAEDLARAKMLSDPVRQKAYQPFGDLHLLFPGHHSARNYRRELDLDSAIATTRYDIDGITYTREVFASHPDNVIVVRLTASRSGHLNFQVRLDSPHKDSATALLGGDVLVLTGRVQPDGLRFESRLRAIATGGSIHADGTSLTIEHADSATLLLVAATSFKNYEDISADPAARCASYLTALAGRDYTALRTAHVADHQRLFHRVSLDLGRTAAADLSTDERIRRAKSPEALLADPALAALEFQYGRYLLIASSRPGSQPANLQGVWNSLLAPPWESKWTTNINAEMNYWPAELTNLAECHEPLFDLIADLAVSGARTARELYRSRGWVVHHNTDLWRGTAPINNIDGIWPTGGAWLCWHLWEHWLFTGDRDFLAHRAYPAMKSASLFFIDTLQRDSKTGWLVTTPSFSPEQGTLTAGPTMDVQLIRSLWQTTRAAAAILGTDADLAAELSRLLPQLPPNQIGRHGQLQEWLDDVDVPQNNHRHLSPLWALYPGGDITPSDPQVYAAAKLLLQWRGAGSTGWSYAWRIPLWARVGDGEYAYSQFAALLGKRTLPNLFDLCGPFQIDGNFGATAGLAEMLLQSHERTPEGVVIIRLLPALPAAWAAGSVTGLRARDGFTVDLTWSEGKLTSATVHSLLGRPARIISADRRIDLSTTTGSVHSLTSTLEAP